MTSSKLPLSEYFLGTITVDEHGQMAIPAEARKLFGIESGDKLLVIRHPIDLCFSVVKFDAARDFLEQMIRLVERQEREAASEENV